MDKDVRSSGIDIIGDVPWATHFCQFYETQQDLIDILVPYFKAGLEQNEFCVWVTSEDLSTDDATEALRRAIPDFDSYLDGGQIEIFPYDTWYLKGGSFDQERVLGGWVGKLEHGLSNGYDGIRISGNTCWLESANWADFAVYEKAINDVIGNYKMLVLCTYSLSRCGASEIAEVVGNHQFALVRRGGDWETIETGEYKQSKERLQKERDFSSAVVDTAGCLVTVLDVEGRIVRFNRSCELATGYSFDEVRGRRFYEFLLTPEDLEPTKAVFRDLQTSDIANKHENYWVGKDGGRRLISWSNTSMGGKDGTVEYIIATGIDITERKKAEEALQRQVQLLQRALLPAKPPIVEGYRLACAYIPALEGQEIGGDFYDVIRTEDGQVGILIGDVSGKGIEAAALAASTRSTVSAFIYDTSSPGEALVHSNSILLSQGGGAGQFVTTFVVVIDPHTGVIRYSGAGHPPAVIHRTDGRTELLVSSNLPLGVTKLSEYHQAESFLAHGDRLILYTDGVTESREGPNLFGIHGIECALASVDGKAPDMVVEHVLSAARAWARGELRDDTALMVVQRNGE